MAQQQVQSQQTSQSSSKSQTSSASYAAVNLTNAQIQYAVNYNKKKNQKICKKIQKLVNVAVDGCFGPQTVKGIANWQAANALDPDGCFGPKSLAKADFDGSQSQPTQPTQPVTEPSTKILTDAQVTSAVKYNKKNNQSYCREIQALVGAEVDGSFGPKTVQAIAAWQSKNSLEVDGKFGSASKAKSGIGQSSAPPQSGNSGQKVTIPSGQKIMSTSYTPDLDLLKRHAAQEGYNVKDVPTSANYVAKYCTHSQSQHQCTRGISLYLQLASYARGEASSTYKSSCAANEFGSSKPLTSFNISSSVANEFTKESAETKSGNSTMNKYIANNLKKNGEFVTFKYASSKHIVFYSNGGWYSDFKQNTATGCGNSGTTYSNVHFFKR